MPLYVQTDAHGNIGATVTTDKAPIVEDGLLQFEYKPGTDINGKKVDITTGQLIDAPVPEETTEEQQPE